MDKLIKELEEQRAAAIAELKTLAGVLSERNYSEDEKSKHSELRTTVSNIDERVKELRDSAALETEVREARKSAGTVDARVTSEARVYGERSERSYIKDRFWSNFPGTWQYEEARAALNRHSFEVSFEMAQNSAEGKRARLQIMTEKRSSDESGREVRGLISSMEQRGNAGAANGRELRDGVDTTSGSGGSFVTPVYMVSDYAAYRQPGRSFVDQTNKQQLPSYGMTVYLPHFTSGADVEAQSPENSGVATSTPEAGYLSAELSTLAGQVYLSQQMIDRAGPGVQFDKITFDALSRIYNRKVNLFALVQALAGAGAIAYNASGFSLTTANGVGGFLAAAAQASSVIETTEGTLLAPSHLFIRPDRWNYASAYADGEGRPLVAISPNAAFNPVAVSSGAQKPIIEGDTGYKMVGLPVFTDLGIPTVTVGTGEDEVTGCDQSIVACMDEVWCFEGEPTLRTLPQTKGDQLTVLLQDFGYIAEIVRYAEAVQVISGTGLQPIVW